MNFIDIVKFMASSLSNLANSLIEGIHKIKCKDCNYFLEHEHFKDNSITCKRPFCNKDYSNKRDEEFKKAIQEHI